MRFLASILIAFLVSQSHADSIVKLSKSGICHSKESPYYERVKNFTPYSNIEKCLAEGGRLPNVQRGKEVRSSTPKAGQAVSVGGYDRSLFEHWIDADGDCMNTRNELLVKLSTSTLTYKNDNKCSVARGRWIDPYTGKIFFTSKDLDVDHLVPLKWAWEHGASEWTHDERRKFANDEANLFAVDSSVNREKGALGPLDWLPPSKEFHCQYVSRFTRIVKQYRLKMSSTEEGRMSVLLNKACKARSN